MKISNKMIAFVFCLYVFFVTAFLITQLGSKDVTAHASGSGKVKIMVLSVPGGSAPENVSIYLAEDNKSTYINWTSVSGSDGYYVYYSNNLTKMRDLNVSDSAVSYVSLSDTEWRDDYADEDIVRFYRVGADTGGEINVSKIIVGKQTYNLVASSDGDKKYNIFAMVYGYNYTFSSYINNFSEEFPKVFDSNFGYPKIQSIDRSDAEQQPWVTYAYTKPPFGDYEMKEGEGYRILLNESYNKTEVGKVSEYIFIEFKASSDGDKKYNLFGDNFFKHNETFASYIDKICIQNPNICDPNKGYPKIQFIDRRDPEEQIWRTYAYTKPPYSDYQMVPGEGYRILVNESIVIVLNNTVIR